MAAFIDWSGVTDAIARAETAGCIVGLSVIAPSATSMGERFSHNGTRRFVAASTVKIAILIELFRRVDSGSLDLATRHTLTEEDKTNGSGVMLHLKPGAVLTLADLAYLMMSISDNTATNLLIDTVGGMDKVNACMRGLGMATSLLGRKMRGRPPLPGEQESWAVPDEYAVMVAAILENRAASPDSCAQMVALLEKQQNDRRIARYLPRTDRPRWGSKTGTLPGVVNDVGFVMTPRGPVVLAVFCEGAAESLAGEEVVGDVSRAVVRAVG